MGLVGRQNGPTAQAGMDAQHQYLKRPHLLFCITKSIAKGRKELGSHALTRPSVPNTSRPLNGDIVMRVSHTLDDSGALLSMMLLPIPGQMPGVRGPRGIKEHIVHSSAPFTAITYDGRLVVRILQVGGIQVNTTITKNAKEPSLGFVVFRLYKSPGQRENAPVYRNLLPQVESSHNSFGYRSYRLR